MPVRGPHRENWPAFQAVAPLSLNECCGLLGEAAEVAVGEEQEDGLARLRRQGLSTSSRTAEWSCRTSAGIPVEVRSAARRSRSSDVVPASRRPRLSPAGDASSTRCALRNAPAKRSWKTALRAVKERGSKTATRRAPGQRCDPASSTASTAVGWWAKSRTTSTRPSGLTASACSRRSTPEKSRTASRTASHSTPSQSAAAAAARTFRAAARPQNRPCRFRRASPRNVARRRLPDGPLDWMAATQSAAGPSPPATENVRTVVWAASASSAAAGESAPRSSSPRRGGSRARKENCRRTAAKSE